MCTLSDTSCLAFWAPLPLPGPPLGPGLASKGPACLPVPIFSQKKKNRQPLTSVPPKNEGSAFAPESFEFSSMAAGDSDSMWASRTYQAINAAKNVDCRKGNSRSILDLKAFNVFNQAQEFCMEPIRTFAVKVDVQASFDASFGHKLSKQTSTSSSKRSQYSFAASSGSKDFKLPYTFKNVKMKKDDAFDDMPEEEMVQAIPLYQITLKEKRNTLRIITASVESMKHWSQYTDQTPLLFELLAVLDSAVTSGSHGSKSFILRDGKNHVSCVFYEIDRDLPRLIRGRVHRVMGNYDKERTVLKCVSVRPASTAEQQTFTEFVTASSNEMEQYIKTINNM
ncbi:PREDICTED: spermatogenesis-associated protein 22 [Nanorana parkeri]|uniref:spermatogenesis-associated protein 22 n=1 Tax=Nanorana parkeri TaxID=125878 RepID=UPI0008544CFF|nr:PREDICTED: spermatogenesis-associated protein 22 [Nanorana parkeri]